MSDEIEQLRVAIADAEAAQDRLRKRRELVAKLAARVERYREQLAIERRDVERLEGPGLAAFVRNLLGDRDVELDREKRELATAAVLHDEARAELAEAREELDALVLAVGDMPQMRTRLERLLRERAALPGGLGPNEARELRRIELGKLRKDLVEAELAASAAYASLESVLGELDSAMSLGTFDLFAGGMLISALKHGKIGAASSRIASAQIRLRVLARELEDLRAAPIDALEIEPLTRFVDVFLDNVFTDWTVQSRLRRTSDQVRDTRRRIGELRLGLRERLRTVERELAGEARTDG